MESNESQSKRLKKRHDPITCDITLDGGEITRETIGHLICEMCKYLMYDRNQIPFPMNTAKDRINNVGGDSQRSSQKAQMMLQMIENFESLFNEFISIIKLDFITIDYVTLSLGPNLHLPKEVFLIQLPSPSIYGVTHLSTCKKISLRAAVTRFFRTILSDGNILFSHRNEFAITKLSLLVRVNRNDVPILLEHANARHGITDSHESPYTVRSDYDFEKVGNRFKFKVNQNQCECINERFDIFEDSNNSMTVESEIVETFNNVLTLNDREETTEERDDFVWVQIGSSIKGFKYVGHTINNNNNLLTDLS